MSIQTSRISFWNYFLRNYNDNTLQVTYQDVQKQSGGNDCGLFVIAFAVDLANGTCPTKIKYVQREMRDHLLECFRNKYLTPFPRELVETCDVDDIEHNVMLEFCPECFKTLGS